MRYATAIDYVREYAENLSKGGLFLSGVTSLKPLSQVTVEVELPGYRTFKVRAQVAHVLDAATAERFGRTPGSGLAILNPSPEFSDALSAYLMRLGKRADHLVFTGHEGIRHVIAAAGYQAEMILSPEGVADALASADAPVAGVVVDPAEELAYRAACEAIGAADLVSTMANANNLGRLLDVLDRQLA